MTAPSSDLPWLTQPRPGLRVWAVEPFFGGSHKAFLEGLARVSEHRFELLCLPGRNWRWRMHGAALTLARDAQRRLAHGEADPPQLLFVSDMLDLPAFLGLAPPELRSVPVVLYFHENQLTYPLPAGEKRDLGYGLKNVASALAADAVWFNSEFHRHEFLAAARRLVEGLPDCLEGWSIDDVEAKSRVIPLGVDLRALDCFRPPAGDSSAWAMPPEGDGRPLQADADAGASPPLVLWNHRWEYDKAPQVFVEALDALVEQGVDFRVAIAGASREGGNPLMEAARERLGSRVVQWGRVPSFADYARLLWQSDIAVSTALHEFFGISTVEAIYCGCRPLLPDRLSYPELIPREARPLVLYGEGELVTRLREALETPPSWSPEWQRTWVSRFDWGNMAWRYDRALRETWEKRAPDSPALFRR